MPDQHLGVKMARRVAYDCSLKGASCASQVNSLDPKREVCLGLERTKMLLEQIGADARIRELFEPHAAQRLKLGRVSFAAHEQYRVYLEDGDYEAVPAGRLRYDAVLPAVGDWVAARQVDPKLALIEAVLPRRTKFSRRVAGRIVAEQVIAANVDLAVIVCGLDGDFNATS